MGLWKPAAKARAPSETKFNVLEVAVEGWRLAEWRSRPLVVRPLLDEHSLCSAAVLVGRWSAAGVPARNWDSRGAHVGPHGEAVVARAGSRERFSWCGTGSLV